MSRASLRDRELDDEFIRITILIQKAYNELDKHTQIKVEKWVEKLAKITTNYKWKQNRNLYIKLLMNAVATNDFSDPFDKLPPETSLPQLNVYVVKNKIGENFDKILRSEQIENLIETQLLSLQDDLSPRYSNGFSIKKDLYEITPSKVEKNYGNGNTPNLGRESVLSKFGFGDDVIMEDDEFTEEMMVSAQKSNNITKKQGTEGIYSLRNNYKPKKRITVDNSLLMNTAGKNAQKRSATKSVNLDIFSRRKVNHFHSTANPSMQTPSAEKIGQKTNFISSERKPSPEEEELMRFSTMKTLMSRVRMLIRNYLEDDSQISNLEESLSLLKLGEKVCDEEITERERLTEEDYLNMREKFEIQLKRIEDLEANEGLRGLIEMSQMN